MSPRRNGPSQSQRGSSSALARGVLLVAVAWAMALVSPAHAYNRYPARWDATYSPVFPVVLVYACPNQFARWFPTFGWAAIRAQILAAANEIFQGGASHIRLRYFADLPDTDPQCADSNPAEPTSGTILITAERNHGGGACHLATTFPHWDGNGKMYSARVIIHRGTVCGSATYRDWAWVPDANYPGPGQFDFWSVALHELGHAVGLDHSSVVGAVMWPSAPIGDAENRHWQADDVRGLREGTSGTTNQGYGPVETLSAHRLSATGGPNWIDEGEPFSMTTIGAPALSFNSTIGVLSTFGSSYLIASTTASPGAPYLVTYRTDGISSGGIKHHTADATWMPPAIASRPRTTISPPKSPRQIVAFVESDMARGMSYKMSDDGGSNWSSTISIGRSTGVAPALAYVSQHEWFVMFFTDPFSGRLRSMISKDMGFSWGTFQMHDAHRTFHRIGIACHDAQSYCQLALANGSFSNTPLQMLKIEFGAGGDVLVSDVSNPGNDSYGAAVAANASTWEIAWRDRGRATVLTDVGGTAFPAPGPVVFSSVILHGAPTLAWGSSWNRWAAWFTYAPAYNQ